MRGNDLITFGMMVSRIPEIAGSLPGLIKAVKYGRIQDPAQPVGIEKVYEAYASSEGPSGFINLLNFDNTVGICPDPFAIVRYNKEAEQPLRNAQGKMTRVKKEGFDVHQISDPLYVLLPGAKKHVPLSEKIHADIVNGVYRF